MLLSHSYNHMPLYSCLSWLLLAFFSSDMSVELSLAVIQLIDLWVLIHHLLIQIYCMRHSILWEWWWVLVDSNIILINLNRGITHEVQNKRRCEWGSNTLWGCLNRLWGGCFCRFECLLLCRRSLCRGLSFSHDNGDSEVELVGGGWWKGFFAGFLYILLENFAKWPLTPTF